MWSVSNDQGLSFKTVKRNRGLTQFVFVGDHTFHILTEATLKNIGQKGKKVYKTFDGWYNIKATKNGFLHD